MLLLSIKCKLFYRKTLNISSLFHVLLQLLGHFVPQIPYRGFAPCPHWRTPISRLPGSVPFWKTLGSWKTPVNPLHCKILHTPMILISLHSLRVPERIQFKIAVLTYRVPHGDAPRYLGRFTSTADVPGRRALCSAETNRLVVPPVRLSTVGSRAFPVAAAQIWNSLPEHIVSAPTLQSFRRHLKLFLLQESFCL